MIFFRRRPNLASVLASRRASVSLMAVGFLTSMLFVGGFTTQIAMLYVVKLQNQRATDLASQAAALTPAAIVGGAVSTTAQATALNILAVNGFGNLSASISASAQSGGGTAIAATLTNNYPLIFGGLLGHSTNSTTTVSTLGSATPVTTTTSDCVAALRGPVSITGTASLTGSGCGVAASSNITLTGSSMTMSSASVGDDAYTEIPLASGASSLAPAATAFSFKATTTDTLASNTAITTLASHLTAMATWPYVTTIPVSPSTPTVTAGTNKTYTSGSTGPLRQSTKYGTMSFTNATLTFSGNSGVADPNCTTPTTISGLVTLNGNNTLTFDTGCYVFAGGVTAAPGSGVNTLAVAALATVTFIFEGDINNNSTGNLTFGAATYSFNGNIYENQGSKITFGAGDKAFGAVTINAWWGYITFGDGNYYLKGTTLQGSSASIGGTTTFGNGTYYLWNATISNQYWSTMVFGNGTYYIYKSAITDGTSGIASMTFGNGAFYFDGGTLTTGTNSITTFGTGVVDFYGTTVNCGDNTTFGNGGSTTTGGVTISMKGGALNVTGNYLQATGGTLALSGTTLDFAAPLYIHAPTSATPTDGITNVAIFSADTDLTFNNTVDHLTGMIYAPSNTVTLSGSATLSDDLNTCLGVDAGYVTMSGTASLATVPCSGVMPVSSGTNPVLTQ